MLWLPSTAPAALVLSTSGIKGSSTNNASASRSICCFAASSAARPDASLEREGKNLSHLQLTLSAPYCLCIAAATMFRTYTYSRDRTDWWLVRHTCIQVGVDGVARMATAISTTICYAASCHRDQRQEVHVHCCHSIPCLHLWLLCLCVHTQTHECSHSQGQLLQVYAASAAFMPFSVWLTSC